MAVSFESRYLGPTFYTLGRPALYTISGSQLRSGDARLAGDFPDGATRLEGAPTAAHVRVYQRVPAVGGFVRVLVASVASSPSGTWEVTSLKRGAIFDVIGALEDYNDVIVAGVSPRRIGATDPVVGIDGAPELPDAVVGAAYSAQAVVLTGGSGSGVVFSLDEAPAWLSIAPDGTLSGTPTAGDIATGVSVIIRVDDDEGGTATYEDTIDVVAA